MTAIDHHPIIGSPICTNSTIVTAKCACAAAVVALVFLQRDRLLEHVAILSLLLESQGDHNVPNSSSPVTISLSWMSVLPPLFFSSVRTVNIVLIQSLLSHSVTYRHLHSVQRWHGSLSVRYFSKRPSHCHVLVLLCLYLTKNSSWKNTPSLKFDPSFDQESRLVRHLHFF